MNPSPDQVPDEHHVTERALLLPEEQAAGSADPTTQAEIILEDSERRTQQPEATRDASVQAPD